MIYLDCAATSLQKPPEVARSMARAVGTMGSPGRGGHRFAMDAGKLAFKCRETAGRMFGVEDPERVVFTSNATHGLNIAIRTLARPGMEVVTTGYEHNSVVRPLKAVGAKIVPVKTPLFDSDLAAEEFEMRISSGAGLAVLNHVSNVFGFELPLERMAESCRRAKVPFIVDASQSAGVLPVNMAALGAAFVAMPGHKGLYGPQGTGLLLCGAVPEPLMFGGSGSDSMSRDMPEYLPDRLEAGTHNMPGIAGLLAGMEFVNRIGIERISAHESGLARLAADGLGEIPGVIVYRAADPSCQTGVLSFRMEGMQPEKLGERLGDMGIAVRAGLHCAPLAHETAQTLPEGTVRASFSAFNTPGEVRALVRAVRMIKGGR